MRCDTWIHPQAALAIHSLTACTLCEISRSPLFPLSVFRHQFLPSFCSLAVPPYFAGKGQKSTQPEEKKRGISFHFSRDREGSLLTGREKGKHAGIGEGRNPRTRLHTGKRQGRQAVQAQRDRLAFARTILLLE